MAEYSGKDKRLAYLFDAVENVQVDDMTGASASTNGAHGLVPAPLAGDEEKYLKGDGTWAAVQAGAGALSGLSDVDLSSPTDGQALVFDGANSKWINGNVGGGGGGNTLVIQDASIYSENEQQVGVWIDGKPLYERTFDLGSNVTISYNALTNTTIDASNMQTLVNAWGLYSTGVTKYSLMANISNNVIRLQTDRNGADASVRYVILQYTKTTDAAGSGGYKAYGLSPIIYSTEEREVGVWTDGKPLYQKTISFGALPNNTTKSVAHGIQNADFINPINVFAFYPNAQYNTSIPAFSLYNVANGIVVNVSDTNIDITSRTNVSDYSNCYVTLQYTKTTDIAGSGTWTTTGEYAHHYSTSEKVIGTWTDGKPLYERVFTGLSVQLNSVNWVNLVAITDVKFCQDVELYRVIDATTQRRAKLPLAECDANNGYIRVSTISSTFNDVVETAIVRYTKTTD